MSDAFAAGATTKPPPGPLTREAFTPNIEPLSVSHDLCNQVECFRVFQVRSLCDPCNNIDHLGLSTSKHKSTTIICTAYSTPGMITSLLSIISSPAADIKSFHVSRSTTQNSGRNKHTNDITNSSVEHF